MATTQKKKIKIIFMLATGLLVVSSILTPKVAYQSCDKVAVGAPCSPASCTGGGLTGETCGDPGSGATCVTAKSGTSTYVCTAAETGSTPKTPASPSVTLNSPVFAPLGDRSIQGIIGRVIRGILALTGVIALIMFVYGGITWMTSQGNSEAIKKAQNTLVWSILGLLLIFTSYALVNTIIDAIG